MRSEQVPEFTAGSTHPWIRRLLGTTALITYALIVIGGIVRITGSGLGCGDDWPLCNGQVVPLWSVETLETVIEFSHRITAATVSILIIASVVITWRQARALLKPTLLSFGLLIVQIALGAITVKVDLSYWAVVPHLGTAMAILGALMVAYTWASLERSEEQRLGGRAQNTLQRYRWLAMSATLGFYLVLLLGALVANKDAMWACLALPICSMTSDLALIQMIHRTIAVLVTIAVIVLARNTWRTRQEPALRRAAGWSLWLTLLQIAVGVVQVMLASTGNGPIVMAMRAIHLAIGAAAWASLVVLTTLAYTLPGSKLPLTDERPQTRSSSAPDTPPVARYQLLKDYISLTKPRVISLLILTTLVGMLITPAGLPSGRLVFWTMLGGWLMASGAHAINCYLDRDIDVLMGRTGQRPLPSNRIPAWHALLEGVLLGVLAFAILSVFVNVLSAILALIGLLYYVFIYTLWLKRTSMNNIVIGGGAGAFPPLVGWAAVTGGLTLPALFLFAIIFYWTPPHFWALALIREQDYARAHVPMLPVVAGGEETKRQILLYTLLMFTLTIMLTPIQLMGLPYLIMALILGALFLRYVVRLLRDGSIGAAWSLYRFSLLYLALLFAAMVVDRMIKV